MYQRKPSRRLCAALSVLALSASTSGSSAQGQLAKLEPSSPQSVGLYGGSLALDGDVAVVTRVLVDFFALPDEEVVDIFERQAGGSWDLVQTIVYPYPPLEFPGRFMALDGDTLFLSLEFDNAAAPTGGAVRVLERGPDGLFSETQLLTASDAAPESIFGRQIAMRGDDAVIRNYPTSGPDSIYFFERAAGGSWSEVAKFSAGSTANDQFGWSLAIDGDLALAGAPLQDVAGTDSGAVYAYENQPAIGWVLVQEIHPIGAVAGEEFGFSISMDGTRALIGAPAGEEEVGRALLFEWQPTVGWVQTADLAPSPDAESSRFGEAVALEDDLAVVGAPYNLPIPWVAEAGSAYVFREGSTGEWTQVALVGPDDPQVGQDYGWAVSLSDGRALIGAPETDGAFFGSGAAYLHAVGADATADVASISLQVGGSQGISVEAGPDAAGRLYLLLGSASGTHPGTPINVLATAPLNTDTYLLHTLVNPNLPPLAGSFGQLDGNGATTASFSLPPTVQPGLVGLVVHHAYVVFDSPLPKVFSLSNPVALLLDS